MIIRTDVVSRGAVVVLPALDTSWLDSGGRPIALIVGLAIVAIVSLLVAAAAHSNQHRKASRSSGDDAELFTTTPLPMPKEELARMKKELQDAQRRASGPGRLPRWVQLTTLFVACGITLFAAQRLRTDQEARTQEADSRTTGDGIAADGPDELVGESPEGLDLTPYSAAPFSFRAREFAAANGGCTGRLEVTKGAPSAWTLTARVHDERGHLIDTALARVDALNAGDVVEFRFRRTSCDRIGAWDVRGDQRTP